MLQIKRIYEEYSESDGYRILVDRLWPRGISKERAHLDMWAKDITPSTDLRKEFNHEQKKFEWFKEKYLEELNKNSYFAEFIKLIANKLKEENVTLLYGAKSPTVNHAIILKDFIEKRLTE